MHTLRKEETPREPHRTDLEVWVPFAVSEGLKDVNSTASRDQSRRHGRQTKETADLLRDPETEEVRLNVGLCHKEGFVIRDPEPGPASGSAQRHKRRRLTLLVEKTLVCDHAQHTMFLDEEDSTELPGVSGKVDDVMMEKSLDETV